MRMCRYEKLNDEAISCRDIRELKEIIIPKIKRQYIAWKDKITEIIDESGYTKKQFARLCHVSRGTLYKWCNGSIPNDRDKYIRVGLVAGYDIQQVNELLQRYGHYSKLYPKRLEDSVCIFVLSQKYEKEVIEKYDYILEKIQKILCADEGKAEGDIPTDEFYKELTRLKGEEELEEFITSSVNVFSFANQRLYAYIKSLLLNVQLGSMNYLAERQGWSSSLRQCISEIRQNKWYPNRKKLISLGMHLGLNYNEINEMLNIAHMEPLNAIHVADSVIIFILVNADRNEMMKGADEKQRADWLCIYAKEILSNLMLPELEMFYREFEDIDGEK